MEVAVWDTYVSREDGLLMHFDILVSRELENSNQILEFANSYLRKKGVEVDKIEIKKCQFCHIERAADETIQTISEKGFDIIEFENCS